MEGLENAFNNLTFTSDPSPQDSIVQAVQLLAEASRTDEQVRKGLGQPLPLQQLIALIDCSLNDSLETTEVALRCVGNACIDNDIARQNVTDLEFGWAYRCLLTGNHQGDPETAILTAMVLYNVCMGFEPAMQQCYRERIHHRLIHLLSYAIPTKLPEAPLLIELFLWISSQKISVAEPSTSVREADTLNAMLRLPLLHDQSTIDDDPESQSCLDYMLLLGSCCGLLGSPEFQDDLPSQAEALWRVFELNENRIRDPKVAIEYGADGGEENLIALSKEITWSLSDTAALPAFPSFYNLQHPWIECLIYTIANYKRPKSGRTISAACQVIGNLLWAMQNANQFAYLTDRALRTSLFRIIETASDTEVLHSAAALCLQLSRSRQIREDISNSGGGASALERLCRHENPMIKQDGIKLLRSLGQDNAEIRNRFANLASEVMADVGSASAGANPDALMSDGRS